MKISSGDWHGQATQWHRNCDHPEDRCQIYDAGSGPFLGEGHVVRYYRHPEDIGTRVCECGKIMHEHGWIDSGGDGQTVCPGDWVVSSAPGEYEVCRQEQFYKTYVAYE